jgi:hypothetical protein
MRSPPGNDGERLSACTTQLDLVLPGLVPGIHVLRACRKGVDAHGTSPWAEGPRDKPGQDDKTTHNRPIIHHAEGIRMPITTSIYREALTEREEDTQLRLDFAAFAQRCFRELNPLTVLAMNWHVEVIAAKLAAVRAGQIRRLIVNVPPRYLKSLLASVAFPAWCLGRRPGTQILCVTPGS